jgi:bifunctional autolysin
MRISRNYYVPRRLRRNLRPKSGPKKNSQDRDKSSSPKSRKNSSRKSKSSHRGHSADEESPQRPKSSRNGPVRINRPETSEESGGDSADGSDESEESGSESPRENHVSRKKDRAVVKKVNQKDREADGGKNKKGSSRKGHSSPHKNSNKNELEDDIEAFNAAAKKS